uniref:Uncharacterized protein n=1 Tax=Arundo donax TaxID=35708 RepID=A0A0A9HU78_ARUDO
MKVSHHVATKKQTRYPKEKLVSPASPSTWVTHKNCMRIEPQSTDSCLNIPTIPFTISLPRVKSLCFKFKEQKNKR